jgi:ACS family pantothenate transporter-like MFS transporter
MAIYNIAQPTGAMLSGAMQGALATNLNGSLGRAGWRWAFIVNVNSLYYLQWKID